MRMARYRADSANPPHREATMRGFQGPVDARHAGHRQNPSWTRRSGADGRDPVSLSRRKAPQAALRVTRQQDQSGKRPSRRQTGDEAGPRHRQAKTRPTTRPAPGTGERARDVPHEDGIPRMGHRSGFFRRCRPEPAFPAFTPPPCRATSRRKTRRVLAFWFRPDYGASPMAHVRSRHSPMRRTVT